MIISDQFREKYFEVKFESSEKLEKTTFLGKITRLGVSKILSARLTPRSFRGPGMLNTIIIYSLVAGILEKPLWTRYFENRIFELFQYFALQSKYKQFWRQNEVKSRWKLIFPKSPQMTSEPPLKLCKLLSKFLSLLGTASWPPGIGRNHPGKSDFFMIFRKNPSRGISWPYFDHTHEARGFQKFGR